MRIPLRRYYGRHDLHFIPFSCYRRRAYLGTKRARDRFVHILEEERVRYGFQLFGYVVMPEHVHLLLSEPERGDPSKVLQALKQRVSRALRRRSRRKATEQLAFAFKEGPEDARAFWQRRVYDFNVWSAKKVFEKLEYMHENQVKRGLVCSAKDWRWSSWSHYARKGKGIIAIDSLTEKETQVKTRTLKKQRVRHPR